METYYSGHQYSQDAAGAELTTGRVYPRVRSKYIRPGNGAGLFSKEKISKGADK